MLIVTVNRPGDSPTTHRFDGDRVRIGRDDDNDLVLPAHGCSRHHAEIRLEGGIYRIVDLGSTNGIVVQQRRVSEYLLSDGLSLTVGEHELSFSIQATDSSKTVAIPIGGAAVPAQPAGKVLYLHVREGGRERGVKIVTGADYVIGRSQGSDVVVGDDSCSGRHAIFYWQAGRPMVRDLDSANGTTVNGEKIVETEIRPGDTVVVGRTEIGVSDRPLETADDDILLKRTRLGIPVQTPSTPAGASDAATTGEAPPIPRWVLAVTAAVLVMVVVIVVAWRIVDRLTPAAGPAAGARAEAPSEALVEVLPVVRKELSFTVSAAGTVNPQRQVTVSAEAPGRVVSVAVERGSMVRGGQEMIHLDDREVLLQIREASSSISSEQVELAREDYERKRRLFADGAVTRSVLDQSKNNFLGLDAAYRTAQARIAQLRDRAARARITAPMTGVVARLEIEPGEFVGPGTPLAVIEDMEEVLVAVDVADRDVVRLRPLQVVEATSDAFPGKIFSGVIERVGSAANPVTRAFEVEARISNPDGELRSGMIISLNIVLDKRSALVVPAEALFDEHGDMAKVMVVSGGTARRVDVGTGRRSDRDVELLSGLAEGDEVIVSGRDRVTDGQPVKTYRSD